MFSFTSEKYFTFILHFSKAVLAWKLPMVAVHRLLHFKAPPSASPCYTPVMAMASPIDSQPLWTVNCCYPFTVIKLSLKSNTIPSSMLHALNNGYKQSVSQNDRSDPSPLWNDLDMGECSPMAAHVKLELHWTQEAGQLTTKSKHVLPISQNSESEIWSDLQFKRKWRCVYPSQWHGLTLHYSFPYTTLIVIWTYTVNISFVEKALSGGDILALMFPLTHSPHRNIPWMAWTLSQSDCTNVLEFPPREQLEVCDGCFTGLFYV